VQITQDWWNAIVFMTVTHQSCCRIEHRLQTIHHMRCDAVECDAAVVKTRQDERHQNGLRGSRVFLCFSLRQFLPPVVNNRRQQLIKHANSEWLFVVVKHCRHVYVIKRLCDVVCASFRGFKWRCVHRSVGTLAARSDSSLITWPSTRDRKVLYACWIRR